MIARRTVAKAALAAALLGQKAFASEEEAPWDVLVAGSGAAGLTAAATAREAGASRVLILEKGPLVGGHSVYSSGSWQSLAPGGKSRRGLKTPPAFSPKRPVVSAAALTCRWCGFWPNTPKKQPTGLRRRAWNFLPSSFRRSGA